MPKEKLFLNTLTFEFPKEPVKFYFSENDDAEHKSTRLVSPALIPAEINELSISDIDKSVSKDRLRELYTSFDLPTSGFKEVSIDFNNPNNENLVKRYYNRRLEKYFRYYDNVVVTNCGITKDIQVWILNKNKTNQVVYNAKKYGILQMDRFTLKVRFDAFNHRPYLLVACDRPAKLLNVTLDTLFSDAPDVPLGESRSLTPQYINKVMTRQIKFNAEGKKYVVRKIESFEYLQLHNKYCPLDSTRPIMSGEMKKFFGIDHIDEERSFDSKYIKYYEQIEWFRKNYLNTTDLEKIFNNLAYEFTSINPLQTGTTSSSKRMLVFGRDENGEWFKNARQQIGVNHGPHIKCPYTDVQLIAIYPKRGQKEARNLISNLRNGGYRQMSKQLSHYTGTTISYAPKDFHILFADEENPVPEIKAALQRECYLKRTSKVKYVGIYISPIHKYASAVESKECYYKIKELFLKYDIPTQCVDLDKMNSTITLDERHNKINFAYTIQNIGVAICAKLEGAPGSWMKSNVKN